jgi:hypothetical protein
MTKDVVHVSDKELEDVLTADPTGYVPFMTASYLAHVYAHNFPVFDRSLIPIMVRDPRIKFGLQMIKGPILGNTAFVEDAKKEDPGLHEVMRELGVQFVYSVKGSSSEVEEHVLKSLKRFWCNGAKIALTAIEWGFSCSEVIYNKTKDNQIEYSCLKFINPMNVKPLLKDQKYLWGARLQGIQGHGGVKDIKRAKMLWHVHEREFNAYYGQPRVEWAFVPWHEMWTQYGARDIRRTWFFRNSYDGGTMRYPIGKVQTDQGMITDNKDLAMQMMSQTQTGGFRIFPNRVSSDGKTQEWEYEPPSANITPAGLMEYPEELRNEILEALGVPPEVIESSSDSGFGSATGRKIPLVVYYSTLVELANYLLEDFERFVLRLTVARNFGDDASFDIERVMPLKGQEAKQDITTATETNTGLST